MKITIEDEVFNADDQNLTIYLDPASGEVYEYISSSYCTGTPQNVFEGDHIQLFYTNRHVHRGDIIDAIKASREDIESLCGDSIDRESIYYIRARIRDRIEKKIGESGIVWEAEDWLRYEVEGREDFWAEECESNGISPDDKEAVSRLVFLYCETRVIGLREYLQGLQNEWMNK